MASPVTFLLCRSSEVSSGHVSTFQVAQKRPDVRAPAAGPLAGVARRGAAGSAFPSEPGPPAPRRAGSAQPRAPPRGATPSAPPRRAADPVAPLSGPRGPRPQATLWHPRSARHGCLARRPAPVAWLRAPFASRSCLGGVWGLYLMPRECCSLHIRRFLEVLELP